MEQSFTWPIGFRVRVIDATGQTLIVGEEGEEVEIAKANPEISQPHLGKEGAITGYARVEDNEGNPIPMNYVDEQGNLIVQDFLIPIITLDSGEALLGSQCWWEPVE